MLKLLLAKSTPNPARFSVLIGHIVGVSLRLKPLGKRKEAEAGGTSGRGLVEDNSVRVRLHVRPES